MSERPKNVGRVSTRQTTSAHGDVGLRPSVVSLSNHEAANPTYGGMEGDWISMSIADAPIEIVDGDRGINYPKQGDFAPVGHCLFLNTGNVTTTGFSFSDRSFVTKEKDDTLRKGKLKRHDVVLTTRGTVGNVALFDDSAPFEHVRINSGMVLLRADQTKLLPRFLYLFVRSPNFKEQVASLSTGSAQPQLPIRDIRRVQIPLPPLPEQKTIAHILGTLDDKIELNRRMNETLESMARALFQSWFVDFDPVRAKLDGRKPAGLDAATAALFPAHFQDSTLGHIPQGWEVVRLDDIAHVMMGLSPDGESYNSEGVGMPLINGPVEFGDYFPVKTKWTEAATRFAAENDLIFCVRGSTTGRRVVSDGKYCIGRGVCSIRAKGGFYNFLYQTINIGLDRLLEKTTGSVFPSLSAPDIKGFTVIRPNEDVLEAYERITKPLILRIHENHHQSRTLATLRDTLLPKLLSGEIARAR